MQEFTFLLAEIWIPCPFWGYTTSTERPRGPVLIPDETCHNRCLFSSRPWHSVSISIKWVLIKWWHHDAFNCCDCFLLLWCAVLLLVGDVSFVWWVQVCWNDSCHHHSLLYFSPTCTYYQINFLAIPLLSCQTRYSWSELRPDYPSCFKHHAMYNLNILLVVFNVEMSLKVTLAYVLAVVSHLN